MRRRLKKWAKLVTVDGSNRTPSLRKFPKHRLTMKQILKTILVLTALTVFNYQIGTALAQSTAFTYQGRLNNQGNAANGTYDLTFSVWNAATGPAQVGSTVTNVATEVSNGLFTVTLDFGAGIFAGGPRWLEIGVRPSGAGVFTPLTPRQLITSTPYAIKAATVDAAGINGAGSFSGNGAGLTNLDAAQLSGTLPGSVLGNAWQLNGNAGIANTNFLGTTDDHPLELKVNAQRVVRLERDESTIAFGLVIPNVIAGYESNVVATGAGGATIAGGGGPQW